MDPANAATPIPGFPCKSGKVRDVYDLGETLLIVASDRISAFDWVLPTRIPDKGIILTQLSLFWMQLLGVANHLMSADQHDFPAPFRDMPELVGRSMLVHKARVVPFECVVRGYLAGSAWKEYREHGTACGESLPIGLRQSERLPTPLFTPATKEESGHDINIPFSTMAVQLGLEQAKHIREQSVAIYQRAASHCEERGILLADTKFEWGLFRGELLLIDEVLTPDSSRFWPMPQYQVGSTPGSYDKQFVRDWLEQSGWDKNSDPPALPSDVVANTRKKYLDAFEAITGKPLHKITA